MAWIIVRILPRGPSDTDARAIHDGLALWALNAWLSGDPPAPNVDTTRSKPSATTPPIVVAAMNDKAFFSGALRLTIENPPPERDCAAPRNLCAVATGIDRQHDRNPYSAAVGAFQCITGHNERIPCVPLLNDWHVGLCGIGNYGINYLLRAKTAFYLLGANIPADAVYVGASTDSTGDPLDGGHRYVMRFGPHSLPPARAFWSVTAYDADGYLIPNEAQKYAVGNRDPLCHDQDGTVPLIIQHQPPDDFWRGNWLPAPPAGVAFNLTLRLYWPCAAALDGAWTPPSIERLSCSGQCRANSLE